jgi:hypothetical protein
MDRIVCQLQQVARDVELALRLEIGSTEQTPIELSETAGVIGHMGDGQLRALTPDQLQTIVEALVRDAPGVYAFANNADRAATAPAGVGQLAVQIDQAGLLSLYRGTGLAAGNWEQLTVPDALIDGMAWSKLTGKPTTFAPVVGTGAADACAGNDSRLSDARTPVNHDHSGNKLAQANTHESADTDAAPTSLHHTLGTGANQACAGNDSRLSDTRTPTDGSVTAPKLAAGVYGVKGRTYYTTGSGTYTTPANVRAIEVELWGAGGGGGGAEGKNGEGGAGIAGGGGGYVRKWIATPDATYAYAVGAGGTAGTDTPGNGGKGGDTTFGASLTAGGGAGGVLSLSIAQNDSSLAGAAGGSATGGDLNIPGGGSSIRAIAGGRIGCKSNPGRSPVIGAGPAQTASNATGATSAIPGAGGDAGSAANSSTNRAGGAGGAGLIIVTEYY